jgi:hypothetical protein
MPESLYEYSDFRGLIHADHPEAIEAIEPYTDSIDYSLMNESSKRRKVRDFPIPLYMQDKNYEERPKTPLSITLANKKIRIITNEVDEKIEAEMSRTIIQKQTKKYKKLVQKTGFSRLKLKKALSTTMREKK